MQLIIFFVTAVVLFIMQAAARSYRDADPGLPMSVEVITYFSMLDLVTDITYVSTEPWHNETLQSFGILFCIMPFAALNIFFMFKCYRLVTVKNLRWRLAAARWPFEAVDGLFPGSVYVLGIVAVPVSAVVAVVLFLVCLPCESLLGIFDLGTRVGWRKFVELAEPTYDQIMEWNVSYSEWATRMVQESLVLLVLCIVGYILGAIALLLAMLALFIFGMCTMMWWLVVAFTLPIFYSIMVVGRTFAIYPGAWVWMENECDAMTFVMREPAHSGVFVFGPRPVADESGQDLGVFRTFHPMLDPETATIPAGDSSGIYYLISSTLMYEFALETGPQIILQIVNNGLNDSWSTFGVISISVSFFIGVDALYRQFVKVCIFGLEFGSPESYGVDASEFSSAAAQPRQDSSRMTELRSRRKDGFQSDSDQFNCCDTESNFVRAGSVKYAASSPPRQRESQPKTARSSNSSTRVAKRSTSTSSMPQSPTINNPTFLPGDGEYLNVRKLGTA